MAGLSTIASMTLALVIAILMGPLLGRLATQWFSGRGLSNLLTVVRGALLPFILAPLMFEATEWPAWAVVGSVVGTMQAIAVGRWVARRSGEWSPTLLGGIALGRSRAALLTARATARGAVVGTLSLTFVQVVLLESLMAALGIPRMFPHDSIGAAIFNGAGAETLLVIATGVGSLLGCEILASWLFQRRSSGGNSAS